MKNDNVELTSLQLNDERFQNEANEYLIRYNEKKKIFIRNFSLLNVKTLDGERYNDLYRISAFPSQGD